MGSSLAGFLLNFSLPGLGMADNFDRSVGHPNYLIATTDRLGQHQIGQINAAGDIAYTAEMPSRRHAFAVNKRQGHILCVCRRPGKDIVVLHNEGDLHTVITAKQGRHFYGHAVFCPNNRYLYTAENDYEQARGVIGVRDADDHYRLVNEYSSQGVGPHEIALSNDGKRLFIANGGINTHPQTGRKKLNLTQMRSSLVVLELSSGRLLKTASLLPSQRYNSIRHLAVGQFDKVVVALQNQRAEDSVEVLLASYDYESNTIRKLAIPDFIRQRLKGYVGDIVYDQSERYFAASAPRGNCVLVYQTSSGEFIAAVTVADACGLNASDRHGTFIVTSGTGKIIELSVENNWFGKELANHKGKQWDNHLQFNI